MRFLKKYLFIVGALCLLLNILIILHVHESQTFNAILNKRTSNDNLPELVQEESTAIQETEEFDDSILASHPKKAKHDSEHLPLNPIHLENELPGTSDWILTNPAAHREVEGYMSRTSVQKGERIMLYHAINTTTITHGRIPMIQIEVFRSGWYGGLGGRKVLGPVQVPGIVQTMPDPDFKNGGLISCKWKDPYILETQTDWTTGVYLVKLTNMNPVVMTQSYAIFIVRNDERAADITFQLPTNTYQAYNIWGGNNLYRCDPAMLGKRCQKSAKVSFDRPYAGPENKTAAFGVGAGEYLVNVQPLNYPMPTAASWNYNMVRWLERNHLDVSFVTNVDTHTRLPKLQKPKLFLTQGHDEYWSWEMRDHVTTWRNEGVDLTFLGSNTAYWQIRFEDTDVNLTLDGEEPRTIVCYRRQKADPNKSKYRTVKFRQVRPEALLIGVEYHFPLGDPYDADVIVSNHTHWIYSGTGLRKGDKIPGMLGYEVDTINQENLKPKPGNSEEAISVTSIFETPLIDRKNRTIITHGGAYKATSGANVIGAGTMQWSWGLDDYGVKEGLRSSRLSSAIETMTWNTLEAAGIPRTTTNEDTTRKEIEEVKSSSKATEAQQQYKKKPLDGWIYEPKNVKFFWKKMGDRPFQREFYSQHLGRFNRVLDIGVRGYNRYCKDLINSTTIEYFQMEPHPPAKEEMNNDGLLEAYMEDAPDKYPNLEHSFDLIIDFGVFGWDAVQIGLKENDIKKYVNAVQFFLKDKGCWALKIDIGWVPNQHEYFNKYLLPYFELGDFDNSYKSGHKVKGGNFEFYFFYKK